ncbi:MAG TPA: enoyl-CoA hydratase/isomerase family protein [Nitrososphaerales archaeon]|nr:enoyl-CoA hydratase/isomerase family protein [Nitrososphaerales archaeon]
MQSASESATTQQYQDILYERKDSAVVLYLNRPEKRNAMSYRMVQELKQAYRSIEDDKSVRVVIMAAKGKSYCAGGDTTEFLTNTVEQTEKFQRENLELWRQMEKLRKPIIAAVHGFANIELIQAVDIVVAAEDAKFGLPETGIGVSPGAGITIRLPRVVGKFIAKELLFTGDAISATEAHRIGIVNRVVPPEKLLDECLALASKIAKRAPLAIGAAKACVNFGSEMSLDEGMEYQLRESIAMFHTKDLKEGITAFFKEKREPRFTGE